MTEKQNEIYELIDLETGKALFRGTKDQCLGHFRNDAMTATMTSANAEQYRKDLEREACSG